MDTINKVNKTIHVSPFLHMVKVLNRPKGKLNEISMLKNGIVA